MANTVIQLKFSTTTATPPRLNISEPAYSYASNTLFIGAPTGGGVIPIGGKFYLDQQQAIYDQVNAAYAAANSIGSVTYAFNQANAAFNTANAAFVKANTKPDYTIIRQPFYSKASDIRLSANAFIGNTTINVATVVSGQQIDTFLEYDDHISFNDTDTIFTVLSVSNPTAQTSTVVLNKPLDANLFSANAIIYGIVGNQYGTVTELVIDGGLQFSLGGGTTANTAILQTNDIVATGAFRQANAAFDTANAAFAAANNVAPQVQPIYNQANAAFLQANNAYNTANLGYSQANTANAIAQNAYDSSNTKITSVIARTRLITSGATLNQTTTLNNNAFVADVGSGNMVGNYFATGDRVKIGNTEYTIASVFAPNSSVSSITISGSITEVVSAGATIYKYASYGNVTNIVVDAGLSIDSVGNSTVVLSSNTAVAAFDKANAAFNRANTSALSVSLVDDANVFTNNITQVTGLRFDSNSGFDITDLGSGNVRIGMNSTFKTWKIAGQQDLIANGLDTIAFVGSNGVSITSNTLSVPKSITFDTKSLFDVANAGFLQANNAYSTANAAFAAANNVAPQIQPAFNTANAAFDIANSAAVAANAPSHVANSAGTYANAAFDKANSAAIAANTTSHVANSASVYANGAFARANNSINANTGGTITGNLVVIGNVVATVISTAGPSGNITGADNIYANTFYANNVDLFGFANAAFAVANSAAAGSVDQTARNTSNAAFIAANAAFIRANNSLDANNGGTVSGNVTFASNVVIQGNLTVLGSAVTLNTSSLSVTDTLLFLGANNFTSDAVDIGLVASYNDGANAHTGIIRDPNLKEWLFFKNYTPEVESNNLIDLTHASFAYANVRAGTFKGNVESNSVSILGYNILDYTNAAFAAANSASGAAGAYNQANAAFIRANSAAIAANTPSHVANSSSAYANAAFTRANNSINANTGGTITGNLVVVGNVVATVISTSGVSGNITGADNIFANTFYANNIDLFAFANAAYNQANSASAGSIDQTARNTANAAFASANNVAPQIQPAFDTANAAFIAANNSAGTNLTQNNSIIAAFNTANAAFIIANSAAIAANTPSGTANAAFTRANNSINANTGGTITGNLVVVGNVVATVIATSGTSGNITGADNIYANTFYAKNVDVLSYINAAFSTANSAAAGSVDQSARNTSNAAFTRANNSINANTGGTITGNLVVVGNVVATVISTSGVGSGDITGANNIYANVVFTNNVDIFTFANAAFNTANSASAGSVDQTSRNTSNASFIQANNAYNHANAAYAAANNVAPQIQPAFNTANAAFTRANNSINANTGGTVTGNLVVVGNVVATIITTSGASGNITGADNIFANTFYAKNIDVLSYINAAFNTANSASAGSVDQTSRNTANAAFLHANAAFIAANTGTGATGAYNHANAAFTRANNSINANTGGTITGNLVVVGNVVATVISTSGVGSGDITGANNVYANTVYANSVDLFAFANAAFNTANAATSGSVDQTARNTANAAFAAANSSSGSSAAFDTANAAFIAANNALNTNLTQNNSIIAAFNTANAAFIAANTGTGATGAYNHANAAFTRANNSINANTGGTITGNLVVVGNVVATVISTGGVSGNITGADNIFANTFYAKNIDVLTYINAAFNTANSASAGSLDQTARNTSNAAFIAANNATNTNLTQNNSIIAAFDTANAAFAAANSSSGSAGAYNTANAAFTRANNTVNANTGGTITGNLVVVGNVVADYISTGGLGTGDITGANNIYANAVFTNNVDIFKFANAAFNTANAATSGSVDQTARNTANAAFIAANSSSGSAGAYNTANAAFDTANAAFAVANSAAAGSLDQTARNTANAAFNRANNALNANTGGTITGDVSITGNLVVLGNTFSINAGSIVANDSLIVLGAGNYTSDILDIGIAGHYNDGTNAHTGLIRDSVNKEWYLFKGYTQEINANNNIVTNHSSFRIDTLNANLRSSNVIISGINILPYINSAFLHANSAFIRTNSAFAHANAAFNAANSASGAAAAFNTANAAFAAANLASANTISLAGTIVGASGGAVTSYYFDGSTQGIRLPTTSNLDFGSGDFTIEFWMNAGSSQQTYAMIADALDGNQYTGIGVNQNDGGSLGYLRFRAQSGYAVLATTTFVLDNTWRHIACVKSGSNGYLFVNGTLEASTSAWSGVSLASLSDGQIGRSRYGAGTSSDNTYTGFISNFRILKGTALYTSGFTVPTYQLEPIVNTQLLLTYGTTVTDRSNNAFTLTAKNVLPNSSTVVVPSLTANSSNGTFIGTAVDTFARNQANAAFNVANSSAGSSAAFDTANAAFIAANNASNTNITQNNSIIAAFNTANAAFIAANSSSGSAGAYNHANAAFIRANNTVNANTGGTITGNLVVVGNVVATVITTSGVSGNITGADNIYANTFYAKNIDVLSYINAAFNVANSGGGASSDSYARNTANAAFDTANAAFITANNAAGTDLTQNNSITAAFNHANAAFIAANTGGSAVDQLARNTANAAFITGNAAFDHANASFITGNAAFITANQGYNLANSIANNTTIAGTANVANYVQIQTKSDATSYYIVLTNGIAGYSALSGNNGVSFTPSTQTLAAQKGSFNQVVTTSSVASIFDTIATTVNLGGAATTISIGNIGGITNVSGILAVNGLNAIQFTQGAYDTANAGFKHSNAAFDHANSGFNHANSGFTQANSAFHHANSAFDTANSKVFIFYQDTAPATSNARDLWVNSDTGTTYENYGTPSSPIWAEFGPTNSVANTPPTTQTYATLNITSALVFSSNQSQVVAYQGYGVDNLARSVANSTATRANNSLNANTGGTVTSNVVVVGNVHANLFITNGSGGDISNANTVFSNTVSTGNVTVSNLLTSANIVVNNNITVRANTTVLGNISVAGNFQVSGKKAINGPAFSAYADATLQTITSGSQQKVLFQVESFDTDGCFASSRFTPNVEGYYQLNAEVRLDGASGTGEVMLVLYRNGAEHKRGTNQSGTQIATNFWAMQVSSLVYANGTTDYFEIYVQQTSGGSLTVTAVNNPAITWFNGCMLRGA